MNLKTCISRVLGAFCALSLLVCLFSLAGCSKNTEATYQPIESDRYAKLLELYDQAEPVLKLDDKTITWQEYCYYIAYHVAYVESSNGTVTNWDETLIDNKTFGQYVLENAEKWVLYDAALEKGAAEQGIALDAKDEADIEQQWDDAVKAAGSEEALLKDMSTYCCNKPLYLSMLRTRALSAKVYEAMYGEPSEDEDNSTAFEQQLEVWAKTVKVERLKKVSDLDLQTLLN